MSHSPIQKPGIAGKRRTTNDERRTAAKPLPSTTALVLFAILILGLAHDLRQRSADPRRSFIPGPLGFERGGLPPAPKPDAFLIRSLVSTGRGEVGDWARQNHLTPSGGGLHNLGPLLPTDLFAEHPEFFPKVNGHRWHPEGLSPQLWNPDLGEPGVIDFFADYASRYFEKNPDAFWVRLGTSQTSFFSDSTATRQWVYPPRWFRQQPDYSDLVFNFTTRVAERVSPQWPDKFFGQLAYYWTQNVPSFDLHPKVFPFLATDQSQLNDPRMREEEMELWEAWANQDLERMGLWHYLYGSGFLIPRLHTGILGQIIPRARELGFTDYRAGTGFNWALDGPQPWLVARLLANPQADPEALLDEYYRRYFRSAAGPMRRFFERCEEIWMNQPGEGYWLKHFRNESQIELFPPEVCAGLRAMLDEAERIVRPSDGLATERVRFTSDAFAVVEAFSHFHLARQALATALLEGWDATHPDQLEKLLKEYQEARDGPNGFATVAKDVTATHPLAFSRLDLNRWLLNDPGPTARFLLGREDPVTATSTAPANWRDFSTPLQPGVEMAGLPVRLKMPEGWTARVEPWQGYQAVWRGEGTERTLKLSQQRQVLIDQRGEIPEATGSGLASIEIQGDLGIAAHGRLQLDFYDHQGSSLGHTQAIRLHAGQYQGWKPLRLFFKVPPEAHHYQYRFLILYMTPNDTLHLKTPSLTF